MTILDGGDCGGLVAFEWLSFSLQMSASDGRNVRKKRLGTSPTTSVVISLDEAMKAKDGRRPIQRACVEVVSGRVQHRINWMMNPI